MMRFGTPLRRAMLATLLYRSTLAAEEHVLVVEVVNTHHRPVAGVVLTTLGDGSVGSPTSTAGKTRLHLAPQTKPGQEVALLIVQQPDGAELEIISPWDWRARVPSFENEDENFVLVVLGTKAQRAMLENSYAPTEKVRRLDEPPGTRRKRQ